jgi:hypothetical protein
MFRTMPATDPPTHDDDVVPSEELVPLSHLELDLPAPGSGWATYLADRSVQIVLDDLGRAAITRDDARRLFDERHLAEARSREMAAELERQMIEQDRQWRSQLPHGLPWYEVPDGVLPVVAMTQADRDAQPRRLTPLQAQLAGESDTFHPIVQANEEP